MEIHGDCITLECCTDARFALEHMAGIRSSLTTLTCLYGTSMYDLSIKISTCCRVCTSSWEGNGVFSASSFFFDQEMCFNEVAENAKVILQKMLKWFWRKMRLTTHWYFLNCSYRLNNKSWLHNYKHAYKLMLSADYQLPPPREVFPRKINVHTALQCKLHSNIIWIATYLTIWFTYFGCCK